MKRIHWVTALFFLPFFSEASSHVSGFISVQYLGGYTYQITAVDYTVGDPENSGPCASNNTDTIRLYFGDGTYSLLTRSNGTGDSVCQCRMVNTYKTVHTYPGPGNYYIYFDALPRVANIVNIDNSVGMDMLIFHSFTIPPVGAADPPVVTNAPVCSYGCMTECYNFNLNAYSPGGDSIAYSLGKCLSMGGVSPGYMIPPGVTINPVTGKLSWCNPPSDGLYNFAILMVTYLRTYTILGGDTIRNIEAIDTEEVELEVYVDFCALGTDKITDKNASINVYPNPTNGAFTIEAKSEELISNSMVEIYNVLGEKVYSQFLISNSSFQINLSSQPDGIYLYRVINEAGSLLGEGKLVIQK